MKRAKRRTPDRVFNRGYLSGVAGRSQESCPHEQPEPRANWLAGWRAGRTDRVCGLTGVAGLQQVPI